MENSKVFAMRFSKIYPMLVAKAVKKGRAQEEVDQVIFHLTGYTKEDIARQIENDVSYGEFFEKSPDFNPNWQNIHGTICGCRIEKISDVLMRKIRCLDKMVDDLAKGKTVEKICSF